MRCRRAIAGSPTPPLELCKARSSAHSGNPLAANASSRSSIAERHRSH